MLRLSYVVHGPIYGRFMGFYLNGFLSKQKVEFVYARCYRWRGLTFVAGFVTGAEIWNARQIVDVHIK